MSAFQDFKMMTQKNVSIKRYHKITSYHYLHSVHFYTVKGGKKKKKGKFLSMNIYKSVHLKKRSNFQTNISSPLEYVLMTGFSEVMSISVTYYFRKLFKHN